MTLKAVQLRQGDVAELFALLLREQELCLWLEETRTRIEEIIINDPMEGGNDARG